MNAPDYWDDQRFILAEYIPLRQQILDGTIRARLAAIADGKEAPADLKERIAALRKQDLISADDLKGLAVHPALGDEEQDALESLAHRIDGHEKFLSPRELEEAELTIAGKRVSFDQWYMDIAMRSRPNAAGKPADLTALEKKVGEVHQPAPPLPVPPRRRGVDDDGDGRRLGRPRHPPAGQPDVPGDDGRGPQEVRRAGRCQGEGRGARPPAGRPRPPRPPADQRHPHGDRAGPGLHARPVRDGPGGPSASTRSSATPSRRSSSSTPSSRPTTARSPAATRRWTRPS